MDDLRTRWGATLPLTVLDDEGADEATITISQDNSLILAKTVSFIDGEADLTLDADEMEIDVGVYDYMITVTNDDGTIDKYPDPETCGDECELPTLEICTANDSLEVS